MYPLLLILTLLPSISAYVDCRTACRKCREKNEPTTTLEVYCTMCDECEERGRQRLREKMKPVKRTENNVVREKKKPPPCDYSYNLDYPGYPGCMQPMFAPVPNIPAIPVIPVPGYPMLPPCESSEETTLNNKPECEVSTTPATKTTTTATTTRLITTSTTKSLMKKKLRLLPPPMIPVYQRIINIPMMPCPFFNNMGGCLVEPQPMPTIKSKGTETTTNVARMKTTTNKKKKRYICRKKKPK